MKNPHAFPTFDRREFCMAAATAAGALGAGGLLAHPLLAQSPGKRAEAKVKEPKPLILETSDGVALRAVYFPGNRGKDSVPIIMVHGWEQRGAVWEPLAAYFQRTFGHAVIVPDLRGHGQSVTQTIPGMPEPRELKPDDLRLADLENMTRDIQACKKHLEEDNNAGELNINMLTVIGAEFGALLATQFAAMDWGRPVLTTGRLGQDVKALALLTPIDQFRRFSIGPALQALRVPIASGKFSVLIIAGEQDRSGYSDAKRLHQQFERMFPRTADNGLLLEGRDTNSHGTQLIEPQRRLGTERVLVDFINQRIVARKADFEWAERRNPLAR